MYLEALSVQLRSLLLGLALGTSGTMCGLVAANELPQAAPPTGSAPLAAKVVTVAIDTAPVLGSANAPLTLVEFSDFQCVFCKRFHDDVLPQLKREYIDKGLVRFVHKDLPLPFHAQAMPAALAARCSANQGGYWRFYESLFAKQSCLECQGVEGIAASSGLKKSNVVDCIKSDRFKAVVVADVKQAKALGISGTPTFVLGPSTASTVTGEVIEGVQPWPIFQKKIDSLLAKQR